MGKEGARWRGAEDPEGGRKTATFPPYALLQNLSEETQAAFRTKAVEHSETYYKVGAVLSLTLSAPSPFPTENGHSRAPACGAGLSLSLCLPPSPVPFHSFHSLFCVCVCVCMCVCVCVLATDVIAARRSLSKTC